MLQGALELPRAIPPTGGAVAADSAVRCGREPAWCHPGTCFPLLCRAVFLPSSLAVLDVCFAYLGARGPVPREVVVPLSGEGRLGPARAVEGPAHQRQQASISAERGGGGPPPSLC